MSNTPSRTEALVCAVVQVSPASWRDLTRNFKSIFAWARLSESLSRGPETPSSLAERARIVPPQNMALGSEISLLILCPLRRDQLTVGPLVMSTRVRGLLCEASQGVPVAKRNQDGAQRETPSD